MCLAIFKPAGKLIPVKHLRNGFENNPHGAGFAFATAGEVQISKGYFDVDSFLLAWQSVAELACLVHFRFATHGERNEFNCHPWSVCDGQYAAVHNGILDIESSKEKSDTGHFVDLVLTPAIRAHGRPGKAALRYLVEQAIGEGNKIALMDGKGRPTIYNEKEGLWKDGVWYSNGGFKETISWFREPFLPRKSEMFPDYTGYDECQYCARPLEIDELCERLCSECR